MPRTDTPGSQPATRAARGMAAAKLGAVMSEDNSPAPSKFCWMLQAARLNTAKYGNRNWLSKSVFLLGHICRGRISALADRAGQPAVIRSGVLRAGEEQHGE